ncbi:hypothetical protein [Yersinia rohdei]|uniref:hypothetical protein n=1 Tax=Yersinia rohdei TaxID=29485 RepID=UPI0011AA210E|nr:hypothetical protein [Yersinia rohdei]
MRFTSRFFYVAGFTPHVSWVAQSAIILFGFELRDVLNGAWHGVALSAFDAMCAGLALWAMGNVSVIFAGI